MQQKDRDDAEALFGRLRELVSRAQGLQDLLKAIGPESAVPDDPNLQRLDPETLWEESAPHILLGVRRIGVLVGEINEILTHNSHGYQEHGDALGRIQRAWERLESDWALVWNLQGQDCARPLARLENGLDGLIYDCCEITIPQRIQRHLALLPVGATLQFAEGYAGELRKASDRRRFLKWLQSFPSFVEGLVEPETETIIRASPKSWRRASTPAFAFLITMIGFGLILVACWLGSWRDLQDWPFRMERVAELSLAYLFLLVGALSHVVVTLLKQDRAASRTSQALSDWLLRIHVRETSFYISAGCLCCGGLAMPFLFDKGVPWQTAFFVGYSYDSFVDLFLRRFESAVAASPVTKELEKKAD